MNGYGESDSPIISEKPLNKTGDNKPVAEKVEKRGLWWELGTSYIAPVKKKVDTDKA